MIGKLLAELCSVIGIFAELGWRKALIRAGAARFLVSVSQLISPRSLATEGLLGDNAPTMLTSLIVLSGCYSAFHHFSTRRRIGVIQRLSERLQFALIFSLRHARRIGRGVGSRFGAMAVRFGNLRTAAHKHFF